MPTYARVEYRDVYPGVNLVYYGNQRQLEYDFVVGAGADPRAIKVAFIGAKRLRTDAQGDLIVQTGTGDLRMHKPLVYQEIAGVREVIPGKYVLKSVRQVGFEIASYDASKPLVIDPVLSYSSYLGGNGDDVGSGIAVDTSGNAYLFEHTASTDFPTVNPFQTSKNGGYDAFVAKLDATGSSLFYSTYLGGSSEERGNFGIALDASGNVYVSGYTTSTDFPTTPGAFQPTFGGNHDAFVVKLDPSQSGAASLVYFWGLATAASRSNRAIVVWPETPRRLASSPS